VKKQNIVYRIMDRSDLLACTCSNKILVIYRFWISVVFDEDRRRVADEGRRPDPYVACKEREVREIIYTTIFEARKP
jgi:hypothetical protein